MKTYYVAKNGQDKDVFGGDQDHSWLTATYAMKRFKAGDTIVMDDGVYDESWRNSIPPGTQGSPTTIKALHPGKVILRPTDRKWYVISITQGQKWIVIDGIDADAASVYYGSYYIKEDPGTEVSDIVISNGVARGGIFDGTYGPVGISAFGARLQILNMESFDHFNTAGPEGIDGYGIYFAGRDSLLKGCNFHDNGRYAIHCWSSNGTGIDRNSITDNTIDASKSIQGKAAVLLSCGTGFRFRKNAIIGSASGPGVVVNYGATDTIVEDNTIKNASHAAVRVYKEVSGTQVINNKFHGNNPDEVENYAADTVISGNVVGPIVPPIPPIPPVTGPKKYRIVSGEITLEEIP